MTKEILPFNDPDSFKAAFISEYGANRWNEFVALGKVKAVVKDMMNYKNVELFSFRDIPHGEQRSGYILHIADEAAAKDVFLSHFGVTCVGVAPRLAVTTVESTLFVIASQDAAKAWPSKKQIKHAVQMGIQLFVNLNKVEKEPVKQNGIGGPLSAEDYVGKILKCFGINYHVNQVHVAGSQPYLAFRVSGAVEAVNAILMNVDVEFTYVFPHIAYAYISDTYVIVTGNDKLGKPVALDDVFEVRDTISKRIAKEQPVVKELPAFPTVEKLDQVEKQLIDMFGKTGRTIEIKRDAATTPVNGEPYTALLCHVESVNGAFGVIAGLGNVFSTDLGRPRAAYTNIDNVVIIFYMHLKDEVAEAEKDIRYFFDKIADNERIKKAFERAKSKTEKESQTMTPDQENAEVRAIQETLAAHSVKFAYKVVDLLDGRGNTMPVPTFYVGRRFPSIDCLAKFNPRHTSDGSYILLSDGQVVLIVDELWNFDGKHLFDAIYREKNKDVPKNEGNATVTLNEDRYKLGLTQMEGTPDVGMYQHRINIKPNAVRDVACEIIALFQKYSNMHAVPPVGALRPDLQEELRQFGTSPIQVFDGTICWVKNILVLGIPYSYSAQHQVDLDTNARHDSYVMPVAFDKRAFVLCVNKRYSGKSNTPSYLLNVVEVVGDKHKPYNGDVLAYILQHLATA